MLEYPCLHQCVCARACVRRDWHVIWDTMIWLLMLCQRLLVLNLLVLGLMYWLCWLKFGLKNMTRLRLLRLFGSVTSDLPRMLMSSWGSHSHYVTSKTMKVCASIWTIYEINQNTITDQCGKESSEMNWNSASLGLFWILELKYGTTHFRFLNLKTTNTHKKKNQINHQKFE